MCQQGPLRLIAALTHGPVMVIWKILHHLKRCTAPPLSCSSIGRAKMLHSRTERGTSPLGVYYRRRCDK